MFPQVCVECREVFVELRNCWFASLTGKATVDGSEIRRENQLLVGSLSHDLHGFLAPSQGVRFLDLGISEPSNSTPPKTNMEPKNDGFQ